MEIFATFALSACTKGMAVAKKFLSNKLLYSDVSSIVSSEGWPFSVQLSSCV